MSDPTQTARPQIITDEPGIMSSILLMSVLLLCYLVVAANPWVSSDTIQFWVRYQFMTLLCFLHWVVLSAPLFIAVSVCASLVESYPDTVVSTASSIIGAALVVLMFLLDALALTMLVLHAFNMKFPGFNPVQEWLEVSKIPLVHAMLFLIVCVASLVADGYLFVYMLSCTL